MKNFGYAKIKQMMITLGGSITYTAPSATAISSHALYNPATEIFTGEGMEVSASLDMFSLLRSDITDRPTRNAVIVYTDPDTLVDSTFLVNEIMDSDTHIWRVTVKRTS